MTREEAIRILDPETTVEAISEIEYYGGFNGETAAVQAVSDACVLAVGALREQEQRRWIPVTERLPGNEVDVIICAQRRYFKGGTIPVISTAFHTDGKVNTEESGYNWDIGNVDMEYDEEADAYIVPEGWWEAVRYGEEFSAVDDFVTHWMPLPEPPKEDDNAKMQ